VLHDVICGRLRDVRQQGFVLNKVVTLIWIKSVHIGSMSERNIKNILNAVQRVPLIRSMADSACSMSGINVDLITSI